MIVYAHDLVIHGGPVRYATLYNYMITALKKIDKKAERLDLKFSPAKFEASYGIDATTRAEIWVDMFCFGSLYSQCAEYWINPDP